MTAVEHALAICGPTASGKTEIAIAVAQALGGEIINADSRQVYRELAIGTGVPSEAQRASIPHHLFQFVDPCERYSAGAFVHDARDVALRIAARGHVPIVTGGTGLYLEALAGTMPMDRVVAGASIRARVRAESHIHGQDFLHAWLCALAPADARRVERADRYRTLRALEAALAARTSAPDAGEASAGVEGRTLAMQTFIIDVDPAELEQRIARRTRGMFERGIADEAIALWRRCPQAPALSGFGYAECIAWHRGEASWPEALRSTIARTRRYAKRQRTWFRRMRAAHRVDGADPRAAAAAIVRLARERRAAT